MKDLEGEMENKTMEISSYGSPKNYLNKKCRDLQRLHDNQVVVQEKIDGSQISWQKPFSSDEVLIRSKGRMLSNEPLEQLGQFRSAVEHLNSVKDKLMPGSIYRGEVVWKPRHNKLTYGRAAKGSIVLFDMSGHWMVGGKEDFFNEEVLADEAEKLGIDVTQEFMVLQRGAEFTQEMFDEIYKNNESVLGGKIEGVVLKNYSQLDKNEKTLMAKWVSDEFKEVKNNKVNKNDETSTQLEALFERYRTEARWDKAIQHLRDDGKLLDEDKDIGSIIKEIQRDVFKEEEENLKQDLFDMFQKRIRSSVVKGFPQYYQRTLNDAG